jgi:hypothetical protein
MSRVDVLQLVWVSPDDDYSDPRLIIGQNFTQAGITVPRGYISDGTSLPRIIRPIFSTMGRYLPAAIIHDYCIEHHHSVAAHKFRLAMKEQRVSLVVRWVFYTVVKAYWFTRDTLRV